MDKEKSVLIKINDFGMLKKFAQVVSSFESDIKIYKESECYNAKSIMGIVALDMSQPKYIEIVSNSKEEIKRFNKVMEEFR